MFKHKNKSVIHLRFKFLKAIHYFTTPKIIVMDNAGCFKSPTLCNSIENLNIEIYQNQTKRS